MTDTIDTSVINQEFASDLFDNRLFDVNIVDPINNDSIYFNQLIVTDGVGTKTLKQRLTIKNMTSNDINFTDMSEFPASEEYHHFELKFRSGVFLESDYFPKFSEVDNWHISEPRINTETDMWSIYFVSSKPISLATQMTLNFDFEYRSAMGINTSQHEGAAELFFSYHQIKANQQEDHTQGRVTKKIAILNQSSGNPYIRDMRDYLVQNNKKIDGIELNVLSKFYGLKNLSNQRDNELLQLIEKQGNDLNRVDEEIKNTVTATRVALDQKDEELAQRLSEATLQLNTKDDELKAQLVAAESQLLAKNDELGQILSTAKQELESQDTQFANRLDEHREYLESHITQAGQELVAQRCELDEKDAQLAQTIANHRLELDTNDKHLERLIDNNQSTLAHSIDALTVQANEQSLLITANEKKAEAVEERNRQQHIQQNQKLDQNKVELVQKVDDEVSLLKDEIDRSVIHFNEQHLEVNMQLGQVVESSKQVLEKFEQTKSELEDSLIQMTTTVDDVVTEMSVEKGRLEAVKDIITKVESDVVAAQSDIITNAVLSKNQHEENHQGLQELGERISVLNSKLKEYQEKVTTRFDEVTALIAENKASQDQFNRDYVDRINLLQESIDSVKAMQQLQLLSVSVSVSKVIKRQMVTMRLTAYDFTVGYSVSALHGEISIEGDVIHYRAPDDQVEEVITLTANEISREIKFDVLEHCGRQLPHWNSGSVYTKGDRVVEAGIEYVANWWTIGQSPKSNCKKSDAWRKVGPMKDDCDEHEFER
ncbi:hypothetical protein BS333_15240 [Vibrio azureus]|uniref:Chitin-binding type-3 domain-containing protein n=1 Tax=Vibrio azureus NBRC 104587 TaxID=1219077 RepID=U3ATL8_9VIBR|nr:hypothetical protein [Vibrio azureus]AUI87755.1 hypothetical protein BS333_15240 [Vibrio azureus]GAD76587.1 hypothetical protein VAZ01S_047_00080 [Vibrio azureus NBRC 104587]